MRFWATYEPLRAGEAIVELTLNGEWQGGGLVQIRSTDPAALYEACYLRASASAAAKGGTLDRFTETRPAPSPGPVAPMPAACPARLDLDVALPRRPVNGLNVEIGSPAARCIDKRPGHWPGGDHWGLRWLASGGSPLVFGLCAGHCPRKA